MRTAPPFKKSRNLGQGHHCWDVRIDGHVVRKALTKREAEDWIREHEKPLTTIIAQIVDRELERVAQSVQSVRNGWRG